MAMGAQEVRPLSRTSKISGPFSMDPRSPGFVNVSMAFATEPVALCEVDELSVVKPQFVAVSRFVAVKAPPHGLGMMELDIRVFILQLPLFSVHLHGGMAITARKHTLCHGRRGDRKFLARTTHKRDKT